jgi:FkbH-like protein
MSADLYRDLAWLPRPPANLRERIKALASAQDWGREVRAIANHGLDDAQLGRLANAIKARLAAQESVAPLTPLRIGLVGNGTLDILAAALAGTLARHRFAAEVVTTDYDQFLAEALNPQGKVNAAKPDFVVLALDWRGLPIQASPGDAAQAQHSIDAALSMIDAIRGGFAANCGAQCLISSLASPPETLAGGLDRALPGTIRNICDRINLGLAERAAHSTDVLLDVAAIAETVGLAAWHDPTLWNTAKVQFDIAYAPLWADHVGRLVAALKGYSRRALVLDLDNTLWGGVIGDDGLEGILIGQGDPTAEAHLEVQRMALALRDRGVVLSVSSKNTDEIARRPFQDHPDMLLKLDHIAVFQANWNDKGSNIKAISEELALGLDSFVFLDDNPAERELVRSVLPEVAVPELPADPALYARTLAAGGYFELATFSAEDAARAEMYQMNAKRTALMSQVTDMDAYLRSLNMEITFSPFDAVGRARISQLINKSNQFNLTTRRYTENDVAELEADADAFTLQIRLADAFGDNGMISVIVCRAAGPAAWEVDTWLMSCRVLNRGVERMVLREILRHARARGVETLVGRYIPTAKNGLVKDHYAGLGFAADGAEGDATLWRLATSAEIDSAPMVVVRTGFEDSPRTSVASDA